MRGTMAEWPFGRTRRSNAAPAWRADVGVRESPRRRARAPEPWEREFEAFEGATVLEDLRACEGNATATVQVVARYAALRLVLRAAAGELAGAALAVERATAAEYVTAAGVPRGPERRALEIATRYASARPGALLLRALLDAGDAAALLGHGAGAFALYRTGYVLSLERGWTAGAARAAGALARLAAAGGGHRSARRWRRRAAVLARRFAAGGRAR